MEGNTQIYTVRLPSSNRCSSLLNNRDTANAYITPGETSLVSSQMPKLASQIPTTAAAQGQCRRYTDSISSLIPSANHESGDLQLSPLSALTPAISHAQEFASPFDASLQSPMPNHFSPSLAFSPLPQGPFDPMFGMPTGTSTPINQFNFESHMLQQTAITPDGRSQSGSTHTNEAEKDPFLSLLEQLAENEYSRDGPSDLDFYLGRQEG